MYVYVCMYVCMQYCDDNMMLVSAKVGAYTRDKKTDRRDRIGKVREQNKSGEILLLTFLSVTNFLSFII